MIEKIKAWLEQAKITALFILAPILSILAYIVFLRNKNTELEDKINQSQAEKQLGDVLTKKVEEEKQAKEAEKSYDEIRKEYLLSVEHSSIDLDTPPKDLPSTDKT